MAVYIWLLQKHGCHYVGFLWFHGHLCMAVGGLMVVTAGAASVAMVVSVCLIPFTRSNLSLDTGTCNII